MENIFPAHPSSHTTCPNNLALSSVWNTQGPDLDPTPSRAGLPQSKMSQRPPGKEAQVG